MSYYWWGSVSFITGIYVPAVIKSLILLIIIFCFGNKSLLKKDLLFLQILIFLWFFLVLTILFRFDEMMTRTLQMNQRILMWISISI